jgi:hypothetical protein
MLPPLFAPVDVILVTVVVVSVGSPAGVGVLSDAFLHPWLRMINKITNHNCGLNK